MTSLALQRNNMVESQVRPSDITDRRLIRAMLEVPREDFVPAAQAAVVYGDLDVPLMPASAGTPLRALMPARVFAKLAQLADINATDRVLIVGGAMGYSAAVLSTLARNVYVLESDPALAAHAKLALAKHAIKNAEIIEGPLVTGFAKSAPYAVILVEGAIETEPVELLSQLAPGGRLAAIVGYGPSSKATIWRRHSTGTSSVEAFDASAAPLPGFERKSVFTF